MLRRKPTKPVESKATVQGPCWSVVQAPPYDWEKEGDFQ